MSTAWTTATTTESSFLWIEPQNTSQQTQGLSDCVKNLPGVFFQEAGVLFPRPMNLDAIRVHNGLPTIVNQFAVIEVGAITVANDIFAAPDQFSRFAGRTWEDLELVAHELTHVQQYAQLRKLAGMGSEAMGSVGGTIAFGAGYTAGYLAGLLQGKGKQQAEQDNPFETAADRRAREIISKLKAGGKSPCP